MKQLSVRDTARATIGAATLSVDYGRPLARGRVLLGNILPFDEVWRTGANAATQFTTSAPITLAGMRVPAGTYTLWTVPRKDGHADLIVNKQSGQWGTEYDEKQDLGKAPSCRFGRRRRRWRSSRSRSHRRARKGDARAGVGNLPLERADHRRLNAWTFIIRPRASPRPAWECGLDLQRSCASILLRYSLLARRMPDEITHPPLTVINLAAEGGASTEPYRNVVINRVNESCLRLATFEVEYRWHCHPDSDELFIVVDGVLEIDFVDSPTLHLAHGT